MRRRGLLLVLAGLLAGVAVAAAVLFVREPTYAADASIAVVRQGMPPGSDPALAEAAEAAATLFESRTVAETVASNLRLDESPEDVLGRLDVRADPNASLVRVEARAGSRDGARRLAQAVTEVATVLYNDRFGPETTASVWEAARARQAPTGLGRPLALALGAGAGALLGALAAAVARRRGRPAKAEEGGGASAPAPVRHGLLLWASPAAITLAELERRTRDAAEPAPAWTPYLAALRDFRDAEGRLPRRLEPLLERVFGDLARS